MKKVCFLKKKKVVWYYNFLNLSSITYYNWIQIWIHTLYPENADPDSGQRYAFQEKL